jgi:hypothetical protein
VSTEAIEQSGLNDRRPLDAADDWVADDGNHEVNSVKGNANAFATVNFPPATFDEIADIDTAGSRTSRVASTIGSAFAAHMTRPRIKPVAGHDRDSFWAATDLNSSGLSRSGLGRSDLSSSSGSSEDSVQRATQKTWAFFAPERSHIQSKHRFS